jgi:F0F1-type ATP synthase beta subunit
VFNVSYLNLSTLEIYRLKGVLVDIKDTIKGFNMIIDGELDHLPESAFP